MPQNGFTRLVYVVFVVQAFLVIGTFSRKHPSKNSDSEMKFDVKCKPGHYCCPCGRSFKTEASLLQHMSDTGHNTKYNINIEEDITTKEPYQKNKRPKLQRSDSIDRDEKVDSTKARRKSTDEIAKEFIAIDKIEKKNANTEYSYHMRKIIDHVRTQKYGKIYSADFRKAGSYSVKTKVGKADEIDTNIVLMIDVEDVLVDATITYIYADKRTFDDKRSLPREMEVNRELKDIPERQIPHGQAVVKVKNASELPHLTYKSNLIPHKVLHDLHTKVKTAIRDLKLSNVLLSTTAQGPALTITIMQENYNDINVDLVPSLPCSLPVTINGWPRKDTRSAFSKKIDAVKKAGLHLVPKGDETWAISYSKAERVLLEDIDSQNECRREVMRFMKYFLETCKVESRTGLPGLSSHIVKIQILWSSERRRAPGYWSKKYIDRCLLDTIDDMVHSLEMKNLTEYFDTNINILAQKEDSELQYFVNCLRKRKSDIENADDQYKIKDEL